jgi:hypothetical protein
VRLGPNATISQSTVTLLERHVSHIACYSFRIIIQAAPPFLVVHTNAAYSRLTGMDSHTVVGKPISSLLSIMDQVETSTIACSTEVHQDEHSCSIDDAAENTQLVAAAAAGRARAEASLQDTVKIGLHRLVVSSGFGRLHKVQVAAKPHQMVGRNVTIIKDATAAPSGGTVLSTCGGEAGSNNTTLPSSFDERTDQVACQISIAPVVSASSVMDASTEGKKEVYVHHRRHLHRQLVTHYVLQLEELEGKSVKNDDSLSSNSTSVEARLLGLTKAELQNQCLAANVPPAHEQPDILDEEEDGNESTGTTGTRKPVTAIG